MKAHIAAAPRAYDYGLSGENRIALVEVLGQFGIETRAIAPGQLTRKVTQLDAPGSTAPARGPEDSLLLLDSVAEPILRSLLAALRERGVQVDYKAVVTPHNRQWTVLELMEELRRERQAIREEQGK